MSELHRPSSASDLKAAATVQQQQQQAGRDRGGGASGGGGGRDLVQGGISPSYVFLQLFYQQSYARDDDVPLLLPRSNESIARSIKLLDKIYPYETHKLGVVYVAPGQVRVVGVVSGWLAEVRVDGAVGGSV